jgi:hypothetical protein
VNNGLGFAANPRPLLFSAGSQLGGQRCSPDAYLASDLALCAGLVGKGELTAQEQAERRRYADQSVEALRQAVAAGFRDVERLNKNQYFDALRARDDFKKLLAELAEKAKTPAK